MKFLILFAVIVLTSGNSYEKRKFELFKRNFGKTYKNAEEESARFEIFKENLEEIEEQNILFQEQRSSFTYKVTAFTDLTEDEFAILLGKQQNKPPGNVSRPDISNNLNIPDTFNWQDRGAVLRIREQGKCGSSWAISVSGALEAQNVIINNSSIELSEQQLLDCSDDNGGCSGGNIISAYEYVRDNGIQPDSSYSYEQKKTPCQYNANKTLLKIKEFKHVSPSEDELRNIIATVGPVSTTLDAAPLQLFDSGLYDGPCSNDANQAVLIIGYGVDYDLWTSRRYWIVKNSWGNSWGQQGYFKIVSDKSSCRFADVVSYPIVS